MSTQTSSLEDQILKVLAEREPASIPEITRALSGMDDYQVTEGKVEGCLRYLCEQAEELESGKWKRKKTASPEEELGAEPIGESDNSDGGQVVAAGVERGSKSQEVLSDWR